MHSACQPQPHIYKSLMTNMFWGGSPTDYDSSWGVTGVSGAIPAPQPGDLVQRSRSGWNVNSRPAKLNAYPTNRRISVVRAIDVFLACFDHFAGSRNACRGSR